MRFKTLYSMNEKFTGNFNPRDFGDAIPNLVPVPKEIGEYSRIESYAHNKDSIWHFVFNDKGELIAFMTGSFAEPVNSKTIVTAKENPMITQYMKQYPSEPTAFSDFSGVEPIKPPFKDYKGTFHIPKEFNMKKFNPYGSFSGMRTPDEWNLN